MDVRLHTRYSHLSRRPTVHLEERRQCVSCSADETYRLDLSHILISRASEAWEGSFDFNVYCEHLFYIVFLMIMFEHVFNRRDLDPTGAGWSLEKYHLHIDC